MPRNAIIANSLLFTSLSLALFSAFGAVMAKQWINEYERTGEHRTPYARAQYRHKKYQGLQRYHFQLLVQALGTVLQLSLFIFLIGLAYWLWEISSTVALFVVAGASSTFLLYAITAAISIYDPTSPFTSRLSKLLHDILFGTGTKIVSQLSEGTCVSWIRDHATTLQSVAAMAKASTLLPGPVRDQLELNRTDVAPVLLRTILSTNAIWGAYATNSLIALVNTIRDVMDAPTWAKMDQYMSRTVVSELLHILGCVIERDIPLSEAILLCMETVPGATLEAVHHQAWPNAVSAVTLYLDSSSSTRQAKAAALSLGYRLLPRDSGTPCPLLLRLRDEPFYSTVVETIRTGDSVDTDPLRFFIRLLVLSGMDSFIAPDLDENLSRSIVYGSKTVPALAVREYMLSTAKRLNHNLDGYWFRRYALNDIAWAHNTLSAQWSPLLFDTLRFPGVNRTPPFCRACSVAHSSEDRRRQAKLELELLIIAISYDQSQGLIESPSMWAPLITWYGQFRHYGSVLDGGVVEQCKFSEHEDHWIQSTELVTLSYAAELLLHMVWWGPSTIFLRADESSRVSGGPTLAERNRISFMPAMRAYFMELERVYSASEISDFMHRHLIKEKMSIYHWSGEGPLFLVIKWPEHYRGEVVETMREIFKRLQAIGCEWPSTFMARLDAIDDSDLKKAPGVFGAV